VFVCDADRAKGWTWNEVDLASGRLAIQLTKNRSSATVAFICASHSVAYIKSLLAAWRSGLLPVLIHEDYTEYEWNQARKTAGDKEAVLLLEEGLKPRFLSNEVSRLTIVSVAPFCEDRSDDADSSSDHRSLRFETATAPRSVDECALGLFTSGTSASPKLIVFKHRDLIAAARIEKSNDVLVSGKRILNLRPHFTSGGLNTLWPVLLSGGTIGLSDRTRRRPLARFLGEVLKTPYDLLVMSPASIRSLCDSLQDKPIGVHGLPLYFGGMTLPQVVVDDLVKAGLVPEMRYGMTEFAHILSKRPFGPAERDVQRAQGDVGLCYSGFEVRELNGRLAFRSDGMASFECRDGQMIGLRDQEGWYVTDDRGSLVQENEGIRIVLEGREHEVIAVNGFRFHSSQVESALSELQTSGLIHECRAIGFSDERTGQRLVLFWNAKEPLDEKTCKNREIQIHRHSLEKLSPFKRPTDLVYVDAWPYMANGKTDLAALRKRYRPA
jgi:acyl-CoA synthetase (AMP-forming)/AMP-acid ligase II